MALSFLAKPENNVIQADTLGSTTLAGFGASLAGIGGAVAALIPAFTDEKLPTAVTAAGLGVVGLAAVAWSIATAGDAMARAYATAHFDAERKVPALPDALRALGKSYESATFGIEGTSKDDSETKTPAIAAALRRLAEAHENVSFGVVGKLKDDTDTRKPALAEALNALATAHANGESGDDQVVAAPRGLTFSSGGQDFKVAALCVSPRTGSVQQLYFDLAGLPHLTTPLPYHDRNGDS